MFSPRSVSSTYSAPRFAELSARPSRLLFSHRWTGQSIAPLGRRRSARLQHSSVMYSRIRPISHLSGPSRRSRLSYLEALPSPCGTPSGGRRASERAHGSKNSRRGCPSGPSAATLMSTPTRRICSPACCARVASGHAAAAPPSDEGAPLHLRAHSITSSARASSVGGTSRPSALAVLRLITNSNFAACSTGRSSGLAPLKTFTT